MARKRAQRRPTPPPATNTEADALIVTATRVPSVVGIATADIAKDESGEIVRAAPARASAAAADPEVLLPIHEWLKLVRDEVKGLRDDLAKRG